MPQKTKSVKNVKPQPTLTKKKLQPSSAEPEPQPTLTEPQPAATKPPPKDRGPGGQFAKGNTGGPGNPHARSCARMLEVFRNAVSEEDMIRIVQKLIEKASAGDTSAAKLIVAYRIGKPLAGSHPDTIDRNEWDHYQKDAMNDKEMALVMNALPTRVGNDVARISLPIMTAARTHELAMKLREGLPESEAPAPTKTDPRDLDDGIARSAAQHEGSEDVETSETESEETSPPLPNRKKSKRSHGDSREVPVQDPRLPTREDTSGLRLDARLSPAIDHRKGTVTKRKKRTGDPSQKQTENDQGFVVAAVTTSQRS